MMSKCAATLAAAGLIAATGAAAQQNVDRGFYAGAELGSARFAGDDDTAFKLLGGYRFHRNVAAEGAWSQLFDKNGAEITAFELVAIGAFPVAERLAIIGKVGLANAYIESAAIDQEKVELTYGAGVQYDFTRRLAVRGQWQRYDTEEKIDLLSIGVIVRF